MSPKLLCTLKHSTHTHLKHTYNKASTLNCILTTENIVRKYLYLWWELPDDSLGLRKNKKCFKMKLHYHSHWTVLSDLVDSRGWRTVTCRIILKQQFVNQGLCAGHEALCPWNKLLAADVAGEMSKLKWYKGHVIQVEGIITSLKIVSQLWYTEMKWLLKKWIVSKIRRRKYRPDSFFFCQLFSAHRDTELFLYLGVSLSISLPFIG